jgi:RNA-directed DNA polymerase
VSADVSASPAASRRSGLDEVRALQHTLYRTAKADPGRRFHALWDKVFRRNVLWRGWVAVRANNGAPGIDKITLDWIEREHGALRLVGNLAAELREGRYRPLPARGVLIPKPGLKDEYRPLAVSAVRDRIVQAALKIVLEPVFEAGFLPCSFGFRPKRSAHDALQVVIGEAWRGRRWVVEPDIASCFTAIPHEKLMQAIGERVVDQSVLKLLRQILRAGVMQDGQVRREVTGAAQGGPVSPLLCNIYLHRLDREWSVREHGVLVRFADDLLVMCKSRQQAGAALVRLRQVLAELGLEPKEAKTRIVGLEEKGPGFRYGHSAARFAKIRDYATLRLAIFVGKRHKRGRRFGLNVVAYLAPDRCGLISMSGIVVPPRANKPWRERPHAAGERRR